MPRYYDMDKLADMIRAKADTLIEGKEAFLYVAKWLDLLPAVDGVIVLPCNVNDSIFVLQGKSVSEKKVERIEVHSNGLVTFAFDWRGMGYEHISINDFGKTVFLSREEAEQALKGGAE